MKVHIEHDEHGNIKSIESRPAAVKSTRRSGLASATALSKSTFPMVKAQAISII